MAKEYRTITDIAGPLIFVEKTEPVGYAELVEVSLSDGTRRRGQVLDTSTEVVVVQVFEGTAGIDRQASVKFLGETIKLSVSKDMLGRVLTGAGEPADGGPPIVWLQASRDGGRTWSARTPVHADGVSRAYHLFPVIEGGLRGQVHVSWMDNRMGAFNVYYRTSEDGGATFGREVIVNANLGFRYQSDLGFEFTYGDYYGIARDPWGGIHLAWGEGPDYIGPGNVFYARSR